MGTLGWLAGLLAACAEPVRATNVVVILADDLGWGDASIYAHSAGAEVARYPTPHIDRLAEQGVRFERGYTASPICSPSRAALLTGRYPQRTGVEFNVGPSELAHSEGWGLPPGEVTLGDLLQDVDYTTALVGKWHLGSDLPYHPTRRGFDEFYGLLTGATAYIDPELGFVETAPLEPRVFWGPRPPLTRSGRTPLTEVVTGDDVRPVDNMDSYLTDGLTDYALDFIHRHRRKPFFLYLAYTAPHEPLHTLDTYYDRHLHLPEHHRRVYGGMISALDDGVGRVMAKLAELGIEQDTLVVFASDNGCAAATASCDCDTLFGAKNTFYEGGVRVPFVLRWPGRVASHTVVSSPVSLLDVVPTAVAAAGGGLPPDRVFDGIDLVAALEHDGLTAGRTLHFRQGESRAIVTSRWKLWEAPPENRMQLFDLGNGAAEGPGPATWDPAALQHLRSEQQQWEASMAAPRWDPRVRAARVCGERSVAWF